MATDYATRVDKMVDAIPVARVDDSAWLETEYELACLADVLRGFYVTGIVRAERIA